MPLKTDPYWEERVLSIKANNPKWGESRIEQALKSEGESGGRDGWPVGATIRRIIRRRWDPMKAEEQAQYRYFYWPESMERGDLLWEEGAAGLELLRAGIDTMHSASENPLGEGDPLRRQIFAWQRPSIAQVKWFWRVTQALPEPLAGMSPVVHLGLRSMVSLNLSWGRELSPTPGSERLIERMLTLGASLADLTELGRVTSDLSNSMLTHLLSMGTSGGSPEEQKQEEAHDGNR